MWHLKHIIHLTEAVTSWFMVKDIRLIIYRWVRSWHSCYLYVRVCNQLDMILSCQGSSCAYVERVCAVECSLRCCHQAACQWVSASLCCDMSWSVIIVCNGHWQLCVLMESAQGCCLLLIQLPLWANRTTWKSAGKLKANTSKYFLLHAVDTFVHLPGTHGGCAWLNVLMWCCFSVRRDNRESRACEDSDKNMTGLQGDHPLQDLPSLLRHQQDHGVQDHLVCPGGRHLPSHPWVRLYQEGRRGQQVQDYPTSCMEGGTISKSGYQHCEVCAKYSQGWGLRGKQHVFVFDEHLGEGRSTFLVTFFFDSGTAITCETYISTPLPYKKFNYLIKTTVTCLTFTNNAVSNGTSNRQHFTPLD